MPVVNQMAKSAIIKQIKNISLLDNQFIQTSRIPTLHFQPALPRLPIPKLESTCERYLAAQKPLHSDKEYRLIEAKVNKFCNGVGQTLQNQLIAEDAANKHTSYISELWFDMYLRDRKALPINTNPILVLNNEERSEYNDQAIRATNLIMSSLKFYKTLKLNLLEPEVFHLNPKKSDTDMFRFICSTLPPSLAYITAYLMKAYPLDMSQYLNLFNTTRIPKIDKDIIYNNNKGNHITIQYQGKFYFLQVLSDNCDDILSPDYVLANIKYILNNKDNTAKAEFPVGILTTLDRNSWADARIKLEESGNKTQLDVIDSALFNVCLDNDNVGNDPVAVTRKFLHSDGANRMFDKSFSLIISKDGVSGLNFEHSWGDGVAVLRYIQDSFKDAKNNPLVSLNTSIASSDIAVECLEFKLTDSLKSIITQAQNDYHAISHNLNVNYVIIDGLGKNDCKKKSIGPDAFMQLAFQVAYHKVTNQFVPTYESCSTAAFKHGRTEAIRSCTTATKEFTLANNSKNNNKHNLNYLLELMRQCSDVHNRLVKEAAMGQGFDRHLFALKSIADKKDMKIDVFNDDEYVNINNNILSTSTLNSPAIFLGGFGPVIKNGLGVSYAIKDDTLGALVTYYHSHQKGESFIAALKQSFEEMQKVLNYNK